MFTIIVMIAVFLAIFISVLISATDWMERILLPFVAACFFSLVAGLICAFCLGVIPTWIWESTGIPETEPSGKEQTALIQVLPGVEPSFIAYSNEDNHLCYYVLQKGNASLTMFAEDTTIIVSEDEPYVKQIDYRFKNPIIRFFLLEPTHLDHYEIYVPNDSIAHDYCINYMGESD